MSLQWSEGGLAGLAEACDLECKSAQGRGGRGELPEDFWKTYSAMANTDGGIILLGVQEKPRGTFKAIGLADVERVRKALWDNLHNRKQISANLLSEANVQPILISGKTVLQVHVPRAPRQSRPVHLGTNPFGGTWLRRYEGDYAADDETVRRLMAERVEDSRDERVLKHFDFNDLDMDTVAAYRNRFAAVKPGHVWSDLPLPEFLERIGAWGRNRDDGYSGLRLAGLLMFGRAEVIRDAAPHYMVDYQERPEAKTEKRWVDRLVPDGTWSGNVYDFFRRVYQKLTADLKVPFQLQDGQRVDDTPVHEALREALANTLIHADYSGRVSILVVKRPDMFGFRNPGRMRIPPELAIQGGNSDCRNRRLQTMFQLVGYGDHAGSGLPKIYSNWAGQHWRSPVLYEQPEPEQTLMELRMSSLVPEQAVSDLEAQFGERFRVQPELARLALITAQVEGMVSHDRLKQISTDHPADITKMLSGLVRDGLLLSEGSGRGMVYFLPGQLRTMATVFEQADQASTEGVIPPELKVIPPELVAITPELSSETPELGHHAGVSYLDWETIPADVQTQLLELAKPVSEQGRVAPEILRNTILTLCTARYLGLRVLAKALDRDPDDLRKRTLAGMVKSGALRTAYQSLRDPRQAYTAEPIDDIALL
ncbi:RNA-binding domain-containing protein [Jeongeupia sp. USM3]|uniref:RNA-binding domain-containing protein n=1 Tax=Jeongeupia sp. USM3 TaxID=1906741 RepID=UPI00089DE86D|nr:RNA-binding domain-containing protein [Jeongeupia sp. USM3]AOY00908.1 AAA family ATPase [Jeongeupia sp. USM3]